MFCRTCTLDNHLACPFHRVQEWNRSFFKTTTLSMLGLQIQLGHMIGTRCMNPALTTKNNFVVLDTTTIHFVSLVFCDHEHAQDPYVQLLHAGLFPATVLEPKTAATFHVLKHFQMLSFMSKVSVFEFYHSIA
ncbi:hypothetical protein L208DRAFT_1524185 [Tricholoma matsutake]|nr:hypothetical protein L208DRAFT_1524185 [Tricholoma matsutake 945]